MAETVLLSTINRNDTFPKFVSVTTNKCKGYISMKPMNWTPQMFYELPSIKFEVYTQNNGEMIKYSTFCKTVRTYTPVYPPQYPYEVCVELYDIPSSCYIAITPFFDTNAVQARNELIKNGIEDGDIWDTKTNSFGISIKFLTD